MPTEMTTTKSILAPVDGSKYMDRNVRYACEVAKGMGSKLTFIHIVNIPSPTESWSPTVEFPSEIGHLRKPMEDAGLAVLERAQRMAKENGIDADASLQTSHGNPADAIVKAAEEHKFDLIVLGAKGHSLLRNLTVGSVCDAVLRNAPCPVLVVR